MTKTGLIWNLTNLNRCVVRNGQTSLSMAWVWAWWQIQNMATLLLGEFFAFLCKWKCLFKNVCLDVQRGVFSLLHLTNYALIMFFLQAVTSALRCRSEADWHLDGCLGTDLLWFVEQTGLQKVLWCLVCHSTKLLCQSSWVGCWACSAQSSVHCKSDGESVLLFLSKYSTLSRSGICRSRFHFSFFCHHFLKMVTCKADDPLMPMLSVWNGLLGGQPNLMSPSLERFACCGWLVSSVYSFWSRVFHFHSAVCLQLGSLVHGANEMHVHIFIIMN